MSGTKEVMIAAVIDFVCETKISDDNKAASIFKL